MLMAFWALFALFCLCSHVFHVHVDYGHSLRLTLAYTLPFLLTYKYSRRRDHDVVVIISFLFSSFSSYFFLLLWLVVVKHGDASACCCFLLPPQRHARDGVASGAMLRADDGIGTVRVTDGVKLQSNYTHILFFFFFFFSPHCALLQSSLPDLPDRA